MATGTRIGLEALPDLLPSLKDRQDCWRCVTREILMCDKDLSRIRTRCEPSDTGMAAG